MKLPLTLGAYQSKSHIASAQRCVNLYGEPNPQDAPFPFTYYPTPGLQVVIEGEDSPATRCLYTASNGKLYSVIGHEVFYMDGAYLGGVFSITVEKIGEILTYDGICDMRDNGISILLVDGSVNGYTINISETATDEAGDLIPLNTFTQIDSDSFYGGDSVAYLDGFLILNRPDTNQFYASGFLSTEFDALDFAGKIASPDKLLAVGTAKQVLYLFGEKSTEIWFNSGELFPFARMPGALINYGIASPHSLALADNSLFWVSENDQGHAIILRTNGYDAQRISTHAIENEISRYNNVDDAVGYTYQEDGHTFYVVSFPSGDKTWCYDLSTGQWHERLWMDAQGQLHRHRSHIHAFAYGLHFVGDWQNGNIYIMSQNVVTDNEAEILRLRSFPHMVDDGNRVKYNQFMLSMSAGEVSPPLDFEVTPVPVPPSGPVTDLFAVFNLTAPTFSMYDSAFAVKSGIPAITTGRNIYFSPVEPLMVTLGNSGLAAYDDDLMPITITGGQPAGNVDNGEFSLDGSFFVVSHSASPFITVYDSNDWSKDAPPAVLPNGPAGEVAIYNNDLIFIDHGSSPFLSIYLKSTMVKQTLPATYVATGGLTLDVNNKHGYFALAKAATLQVFDINDTYSEIATGISLAGKTAVNLTFSAEDDFMLLTFIESSVYKSALYRVSDWSLVWQINHASTPKEHPRFSPDDLYVSFAYAASPYCIIRLVDDGTDQGTALGLASAGQDTAWSYGGVTSFNV